jgi:hypothetical protein
MNQADKVPRRGEAGRAAGPFRVSIFDMPLFCFLSVLGQGAARRAGWVSCSSGGEKSKKVPVEVSRLVHCRQARS